MTLRLKHILTILFLHFLMTAVSQNQTQEIHFDKQKWLTSVEYRSEIVNSKIFPKIETMSRRQIIKLLGKPYKETGKELTYCLDIILS